MVAEELEEAENARLKVVPARMNMIRLTKAHHLANPTLCDAYRIWT